MIDLTAADEISDDARARSNVVRLAAAQALTGANSAVIFATGSIVGASLAVDMSLATVPLSMYVLGLAAGTLPTGAISRAYGRRVAFIIGTGCGVLTGLLGAFAILRGSFALFCCATFIGGLYGAVSQSSRFAAEAGAVGPSRRPPAARHRAATAVHRRRDLRHRLLSDDESGNDVGPAGDEDMRAQRQRFQFRHPVAYRCDVRAELFHRLPDRALRGAKGGGDGPVARGRRRDDRIVRHNGAAFLGDADRARGGLESELRRRLRAG